MTRQMYRRMYRRISLIVLVPLLIGLLPQLPAQARTASVTPPSPSWGEPGNPLPTPPPVHKLSPAVDPQYPTLRLDLALPPMIAVGEDTTLTLTVANDSSIPAHDVVVTLPVPEGAAAVGTTQPAWTWTLARLERRSTTTLTAKLRQEQLPAAGAVRLQPQVTAKNLPWPVTRTVGALVVDRAQSSGRASFSPGAATTLRSGDGRLDVQFPTDATDQALTLEYTNLAAAGINPGLPPAGFYKGFGVFALDAKDGQGRAVHNFARPLTIRLRYSLAQIQALGMAEQDLTLFWFDESQPAWVHVPTDIDSATGTASAVVDHFSYFEFGDGSSASSAFIPSLQGWQVGLYTGNASYSMPIDVPAGPGGLKPHLELSYNSAATDGAAGQRTSSNQAGWVGLGWSLDTGSIALNKTNIDPNGGLSASGVNYYSLVLNGQSFDLIRGACLNGPCSNNQPWGWEWHTADESYMRIRAVQLLGGASKWQVWTKDGTLYEYAEVLWWGWNACPIQNYAYREPYRWMLSRVQDVYGNLIDYGYGRLQEYHAPTCYPWGDGMMDEDVWPLDITWGGNPGTGAPARYKVHFDVAERTFDDHWETAAGQTGHSPHQTKQLNNIQVFSNQSNPYNANAWDQARGYHLEYFAEGDSLTSDASQQNGSNWEPVPGNEKLTLKIVQRFGRDGGVLPPLEVNYGRVRGTGYYPNGDWNRLNWVANHNAGQMWMGYETIGSVVTPGTNNPLFRNNRRVSWRSLANARTPDVAWYYVYSHPAYNWLGTESNVPQANNPNCTTPLRDCPNSATLYYSKNDPQYRVHKPLTEFRGHNYVIEFDPNGNFHEHWFNQGDNNCAIGAVGDTCYGNQPGQPPRDGVAKREFLKGREYRSLTRDPDNSMGLSQAEVLHTFELPYYAYGGGGQVGAYEPLAGLWYGQTYESQTDEKSLGDNGGGGLLTKTKRSLYTYETNPAGYGRLLAVAEEDATTLPATRLRRTAYTYAIPAGDLRDTSRPYIVDRRATETIYDGAVPENRLAATLYTYDNSLTLGQIVDKGRLTLTRKMDLAIPPLGQPYKGSDTSYVYDAYGNPTQVTTYEGAGTAAWNGSTWTNLSAPGNGSVARTTTTTYDTLFHAFREQVTPPTVNGVTLTESATYDKRLGTMLSITDPNNQVTRARYDEFGRMIKLAKPGDTIDGPNALPTMNYIYADWEGFFHYVVWRLEDAATGVYRPTQTFYDGLGRLIQTKRESGTTPGTQNIVVDKIYNGMDQVIKESQPRYQNVTAQCDFFGPCDPNLDPSVRWTETTYETLGRISSVKTPDQKVTAMWHWMPADAIGWAVTTTDANWHKTRHYYDVFGRLRKVLEFSGASASGKEAEPDYTSYSTTTYEYSPLDLLTRAQTQDTSVPTLTSVTTMGYDSLGRKTTMTDADMGTWNYQYDINGNLRLQTDARGWQISFGYDALNRLTGKTYPLGHGDAVQYIYDQSGGAYGFGKGRRTTATRVGSTITYQYDLRGRTSGTTYALAGLIGGYTFGWVYDSADRVKNITYPASGEVVTYTYDPAWRPTSACTSLGGCYISNTSLAQYSALDQPEDITFGNGLNQHWQYGNDPNLNNVARLVNLTVGPGGSRMNRSYGYDSVGNVAWIQDANLGERQNFEYDHRDRLTHAWTDTLGQPTSYNETYAYNGLGNLTQKAGVNYVYGPQPGANGGPHAVMYWGNASFSYDAVGNLLQTGGRTYNWNADNQPTGITTTNNNVTEWYTYDADGERIKRVRGSVTTFYMGGLLEVDTPSYAQRYLYTFNGQVIAQRTVSSSGSSLIYLHGDHLGSVSLTTNSAGSPVSQQEFKPWGERRGPGAVNETTLNYTGQRLDGTGLLYYHSRYYDPALARWVSPDSIVPSVAIGTGGVLDTVGENAKISHRGLTVDYHETNFVAATNKENAATLQRGFWFQLSNGERSITRDSTGPLNPQALNRYSYVLNNPLRYVDPSGHVSQKIARVLTYKGLQQNATYGYETVYRDAAGRNVPYKTPGAEPVTDNGRELMRIWRFNGATGKMEEKYVWSDSKVFQDFRDNVDNMAAMEGAVMDDLKNAGGLSILTVIAILATEGWGAVLELLMGGIGGLFIGMSFASHYIAWGEAKEDAYTNWGYVEDVGPHAGGYF